MGKAKQSGKAKPAAANGAQPRKTPRAKTGRRPTPSLATPTDAQLGQPTGVPDEAQLTAMVGRLDPKDRAAFTRARELLAQHLGSDAAARLWLVTPDTGFQTTALDAIRDGKAKLVLATLESQWGPSPSYA